MGNHPSKKFPQEIIKERIFILHGNRRSESSMVIKEEKFRLQVENEDKSFKIIFKFLDHFLNLLYKEICFPLLINFSFNIFNIV